VFSSLRGGSFVALHTGDLDVVRLGLAGGAIGRHEPAGVK
jgi:hypothetical protein